ncbi:hypothetical protein NKH77_25785 [Streptomyces sp. M19]
MGEVAAYLPAGLAVVLAWYELRLPRGSRSVPGCGSCARSGCAWVRPWRCSPAHRGHRRAALVGARPVAHLLGRELEMAAMFFLVWAVLRLDLAAGRPRPSPTGPGRGCCARTSWSPPSRPCCARRCSSPGAPTERTAR